MRARAPASVYSASPRKWKSTLSHGDRSRVSDSHPTEGESSSGIPASPSSAGRGKPASATEDDDAEADPGRTQAR